MSTRDRILEGVREALTTRESVPHPGPFLGWRADPLRSAIEGFTDLFEKAGGRVVRVADEAAAHEWLAEFGSSYESAAVGVGVPPTLNPGLPNVPPEQADLGVSIARCAVGETGTLILGSEDGRKAQLLPPTHVILVREVDIHATLGDALEWVQPDLPSTLGLHSGPSKSADIGQILVKGVHGPGDVTAVLIGEDTSG